jgi:hypothetical protein
LLQPRKRSGHPHHGGPQNSPAEKVCGLTRKRLCGLGTNGGSHQHPPAPGCGELKNRLLELARETYKLCTGGNHWRPQYAGQTWQTLTLAPGGIRVLRGFLVFSSVPGEKHCCASTVAASAAKGGAHLQPPFIHASVATQLTKVFAARFAAGWRNVFEGVAVHDPASPGAVKQPHAMPPGERGAGARNRTGVATLRSSNGREENRQS